MPEVARRRARRVVVLVVVLLQLGFVVRGYSSAHREFAFQMFSESTEWRADIVRVTADGRRIAIDEPWSGYRWSELVTTRALWTPELRHHADAGIESQLAFLQAALDYVAVHTPRDTETVSLEANVTYWRNGHPPRTTVLTSRSRGGER